MSRVRIIGSVALAVVVAWLCVSVLSLRSDLAATKRDAWETRAAEERALAAVQRVERVAVEYGARLDDVERLTMELQDGMPPDSYRNGFPEPEDEHQPRRRWRCVGKTCASVAAR